MRNGSWSLPPCWCLVALLCLSVAGCYGCTSSTNPPSVGSAATNGTDVPAEPTGAEGLETVGSYVPPQIRSRILSADGSKQTEELVPNDLHVRLFNDDEVVTIGSTRVPMVADAKKQTISMLAHTCTKPGCASHGKRGRPILFTQPYDVHQISPDGKVWQQMDLNSESEQKRVWGPPLCPICGSNSDVQIYVLPEVAPRLARLKDELKQSRAAFALAQGPGTTPPTGVRPPVEIFNEINGLPQLFIIRQLKSPKD